MICEKCGKSFNRIEYIDGNYRDLGSRKHCLECVPFNKNRTKTQTENVNVCVNCGKPLKKNAIRYCSNSCEHEYIYKSYIERWKNGLEDGIRGKYQISSYIKKYLFEKYNNCCCKCGWSKTNIFTKKIPLEVHHIDGDYTNNHEENLELLCPNCHSLTETYKNGNINKGRKLRLKYAM